MPTKIRNVSKNGHWPLQGQIFSQLFNRYIDFAVEDTATIEFVTRCADYFNSLDARIIDNLCSASIRYCDDFLSMVGAPAKQFPSKRDVLKLISPSLLLIPNIEDRDIPIIHMELNCIWEVEHGMEWLIREDEVLYVGGFNCVDPWGEFLKKEIWNYA